MSKLGLHWRTKIIEQEEKLNREHFWVRISKIADFSRDEVWDFLSAKASEYPRALREREGCILAMFHSEEARDRILDLHGKKVEGVALSVARYRAKLSTDEIFAFMDSKLHVAETAAGWNPEFRVQAVSKMGTEPRPRTPSPRKSEPEKDKEKEKAKENAKDGGKNEQNWSEKKGFQPWNNGKGGRNDRGKGGKGKGKGWNEYPPTKCTNTRTAPPHPLLHTLRLHFPRRFPRIPPLPPHLLHHPTRVPIQGIRSKPSSRSPFLDKAPKRILEDPRSHPPWGRPLRHNLWQASKAEMPWGTMLLGREGAKGHTGPTEISKICLVRLQMPRHPWFWATMTRST